MKGHHSLRIVFAATLSACAASCGGTPTGAQKAAPAAAAATSASVEVALVKRQALSAAVPLPSELQSYESVPMFPKVNGFVKSIAVDRGSRVKEGQVIIRLEAPELVAQRAEAQAKLQSAQAQLAAVQARRASDEGTYERLKAAAATPGVVAGNDLEVSQKSLEAVQAQVKAQEDAVTAATQALQALTEVAGYLDVKAPFGGVVTERNVHPGALVGPSGATGGAMPMVRIERVSRLRLLVPVPQAYIAGIRGGRTVEFTVPAYPGRIFTGTVARIAHSVDVRTRTMAVELEVPNVAGELAPGTFAEARWPVERPEPTLFVPVSAVTSTLERTFVVRIAGGKTDWVDVRTGVATGGLTEVFGDLREGDQVAMRGTDELRSGMAVTATPAANR